MRHPLHRPRPLEGVALLLAWVLLAGPGGCVASRQGEQAGPPAESWDLSADRELPADQELPSFPAANASDYQIGPGDVMNILVYGEPDLTAIVRVSRDGFVEFPLIGQVRAAGLTPPELKRRIEAKLKEGYLVNPDVQIILQEYRQDVVHLMGQVAAPGPYRITHANTLLGTISKAGGFTPIAKRNKVKIIRKEDGKSRVFFVDTTRITKEGNLQEDVLLMPGDVIIVPERFF